MTQINNSQGHSQSCCCCNWTELQNEELKRKKSGPQDLFFKACFPSIPAQGVQFSFSLFFLTSAWNSVQSSTINALSFRTHFLFNYKSTIHILSLIVMPCNEFGSPTLSVRQKFRKSVYVAAYRCTRSPRMHRNNRAHLHIQGARLCTREVSKECFQDQKRICMTFNFSFWQNSSKNDNLLLTENKYK